LIEAIISEGERGGKADLLALTSAEVETGTARRVIKVTTKMANCQRFERINFTVSNDTTWDMLKK